LVYIREDTPTAKSPKKGRRRTVRQPKDNPWKDLFEALDIFDPKFSFERHQPPQQVRKWLEDWASPKKRRRPRRARNAQG
jgi:hypothetical protein